MPPEHDEDQSESILAGINLVQGRCFRTPDADEPTRHLFVANCGVAAGISNETITDLFRKLRAVDLQLYSDRRSIVFASFATIDHAKQAMSVLLSEETRIKYRAFTVRFADLAEEQVITFKFHV